MPLFACSKNPSHCLPDSPICTFNNYQLPNTNSCSILILCACAERLQMLMGKCTKLKRRKIADSDLAALYTNYNSSPNEYLVNQHLLFYDSEI